VIYVDRNSVTKSQTGKHAQKATTPAQRPLFQGNLCNRYQVEPFRILIRKDTAGSGNGSGIRRTTSSNMHAPRSSQVTIHANTSSLHFTVHTRDAIPDPPTYSVKAPCGSVYMQSGLLSPTIAAQQLNQVQQPKTQPRTRQTNRPTPN